MEELGRKTILSVAFCMDGGKKAMHSKGETGGSSQDVRSVLSAWHRETY